MELYGLARFPLYEDAATLRVFMYTAATRILFLSTPSELLKSIEIEDLLWNKQHKINDLHIINGSC